MTLHALKEPIVMVSRSCPGGSPPRFRLPQTSRRTLYKSSRVLTALDAEMGSKTEKDDDSMEILGPFPAASKSKGRVREPAKPLHPFFLNGADTVSKPTGSRNKTTLSLHDAVAGVERTSTSMAGPTKQGAKSLSEDHTATSSKFKLDARALPTYSYRDYSPKATTVYTQHEAEANDLVETLRGPLGFDMEWRVMFRRGVGERRTALVQLSDERLIVLVQVSSMTKFPQKVKEVIESPEVIKLGANIHNDAAKLFRDFGIRAKNLVELGALARHVDPSFAAIHKQAKVSLANVVAYYAGRSLKKGTERLGNWEARLEENMINYAANDAHCAIIVYKKIKCIAAEQEITLSPAAYTSNITGLSETSTTVPFTTEATTITTTSINTMKNTPTPEVSTTSVPSERPRAQHMRAYYMWHHHSKPLDAMCAELTNRGEPLKESTVISYVVRALQSDHRLPFDIQRLKGLVQMELGSWRRHSEWIAAAEAEGRGA